MTFATNRNPALAIRATGAGTPVILIHGSFSQSGQWRSLTEYLQGRHRIVAVDLPGYGGSRGIAADSIDDIASSLRPLLSEGPPAHLVGHAFGSAVALKAAVLFPDRVRSLTLLEPVAAGAVRKRSDLARRQLRAALLRSEMALAEGDAWNATREIIDFWYGSGAWDRTSFRLQQALAAQIGLAHRDHAALVADTADERGLAAVSCAALSVSGSLSPAIIARSACELTRALPRIRREEIAGAGHMAPLTDPHVVDPMIGSFLAQVDKEWQNVACSTPLAA